VRSVLDLALSWWTTGGTYASHNRANKRASDLQRFLKTFFLFSFFSEAARDRALTLAVKQLGIELSLAQSVPTSRKEPQ
jgi:hypothetical protein